MNVQQATPETQQETIDRLQKDVNFLRCLESAGVDNWSGYHYAYEIMKENYPEQYKEIFGDDF